MKFRNFKSVPLRGGCRGGHILVLPARCETEVPKHLEELALRIGGIPIEDIEDFAVREAREAAELAVEKARVEQDEADVAAEEAKALEAAAASAKRSAASKKAAATRKANSNKE